MVFVLIKSQVLIRRMCLCERSVCTGSSRGSSKGKFVQAYMKNQVRKCQKKNVQILDSCFGLLALISRVQHLYMYVAFKPLEYSTFYLLSSISPYCMCTSCFVSDYCQSCTGVETVFPRAGRESEERDLRLDKKVSALESLLASKLAEFLDSSFPYTLHQIPSSAKTHLYKGSTAAAPPTTASSSQPTTPSCPFVSESARPHPTKGGWCISHYLTYDWYMHVCLCVQAAINTCRS